MKVLEDYLLNYHAYPLQIAKKPSSDLQTIVVIPCFNEPNLLPSLTALKTCRLPKKSVEIILVINSSADTSEEIRQINQLTLHQVKAWIEKNKTEKLNFHIIFQPDLPPKFAGVGLARKIGMDEAVARFIQCENIQGVIVGFDADSLCSPNYLCEIEQLFEKKPKANACSIYFEHPINGIEFEPQIYERIIEYELYLRYYIQALRYCKFPYSYHTIGSSFAVKALVYAMQGGMNRRKAGEDFYFLQKIIPLGNFEELNSAKVIPSPRPSDRVPFGTGAAIQKLIIHQNQYETYALEAFFELKVFFEKKQLLYKQDKLFKDIPTAIEQFLIGNHFLDDLYKINKNSPNITIFNKRFFDWFDAFRVLKFLNFAHEALFFKQSIVSESTKLLQIQNISVQSPSAKDLLMIYRTIDLKGWNER